MPKSPDIISPEPSPDSQERKVFSAEEADALLDKFFGYTKDNPSKERFKHINAWWRKLRLAGRPANQFTLREHLRIALMDGEFTKDEIDDLSGVEQTEEEEDPDMSQVVLETLREEHERKNIPPRPARPAKWLNAQWNKYHAVKNGSNKIITPEEQELARLALADYYADELTMYGAQMSRSKREKIQEKFDLLTKQPRQKVETKLERDRREALLMQAKSLLDEMEEAARTGGSVAADKVWRAKSGDNLNALLNELQNLPEYQAQLAEIAEQVDRIDEVKKNYKAPVVSTPAPVQTPVAPSSQTPFPTARILPPTIPSRETTPTPTPEQVPPTTPETPTVEQPQPAPRTEAEIRRDLEERLNNAREKYLRNKKAWQEAQGVMGWLGKKEEKERIKSEFDKAKTAYETARAEYVGVEIELALAERLKFEDAEAKIVFGEKPPGIIRKFYQRLGETSILGVDVKNNASWLKKFAFNNRTLISAGLLGASIAASGPLGWVAAGGSLMLARRAFSGLGAGFAVRDLFTNARRVKVESQRLEANATLEEQNQAIQTFKSRALVDGAYSTLENNPAYLALIAARDAKMKQEFAEASPEQRAELIKNFFERQEDISTATIEQEKKWNRRALAAGIGAGVFIGSGAASHLAGKAMTGIREGYAWFKDMVGFRFAPDIAHAAEVVSTSSAEASNISLEVGSRGIEGTLLDLKNSNPDAYKAMIENMHASDPEFQGSDEGLIHRHIENFAEAKGYNVDGGDGKDLSRIFSSGVTVDTATGNVSIENIKFMPESVAESVAEPSAVEDVSEVQESADDSSATEPASSEQINSTEQANRFAEASMKPTTTEALRVVLSPEGYAKFLTDISLNEEKLNVLTDKTYLEFLAFCKESPENLETYGKLADLFTDNKIPMTGQGGMKMKEVLIAVAEGRGR